MKYTLTINNPKTGWAHAEEKEVRDLNDALEQVFFIRRTTRTKLQFGLTIQTDDRRKGKTFYIKTGQVLGVSDGQPAWLWLTQFDIPSQAS